MLVHRVPVDGEFTLNDLAGSGGRMDEVCSIVTASFLVSNGIRRDTELTLLLTSDPTRPRSVHLSGARLKFLNPDERSTAALLKNALVRSQVRPQEELETTPGIRVGPAPQPLERLRTFLDQKGAIWATEEGEPLRTFSPATRGAGTEVAAVVSDPYDPTAEETGVLKASGVPRISLGPRSLRASQCIVLLHNEWDLREASPAPPAPPGAT